MGTSYCLHEAVALIVVKMPIYLIRIPIEWVQQEQEEYDVE